MATENNEEGPLEQLPLEESTEALSPPTYPESYSGFSTGEPVVPWSEIKYLQKEIEWANDVLDYYGAPRRHYNPYEGEEFDLNLPGRLVIWLDPKNEGGWIVRNPEVQRLIDRGKEDGIQNEL